MEKFTFGERYRLELHWSKAKYEQEGICKLSKAYFSGPVLKEANRLNDKDSINLDFFTQYFFLARNPYVAKLSWSGVDYKIEGKIYLRRAVITHDTELNRVPKLSDDDFLVIDTSDHTEGKHQFHTVYKTYVVNEDEQLYDFRR